MIADERFSYELRLADLESLAARSAQSTLRPRLSPPYIAGALLRTALVFLFCHVVFGPDADVIAAVLAIAVGGAWFAWAPRHAHRLVLTRMRERLGASTSAVLLGPRTLEVGPEGFVVSGPESELKYRWSALQRVVQTPDRVFLYITGFNAHAVPLPPEEAARLMRVLERYVPASRWGGV